MRIFDFFCEFTVAFYDQVLYIKSVRKTNDFFLHILLIPKKQMPVSICLFVFRHDRRAVVTIYFFFLSDGSGPDDKLNAGIFIVVASGK